MSTLAISRSRMMIARLNGRFHEVALWLFMAIVFLHWVEHLAQVYQVYLLGWLPSEAGGFLGLYLPQLAQSEVLHTLYNTSILVPMLLLLPAFVGRARRWWLLATAIQSWHFFEHALLQIQWLTGIFLFDAPQQTSILQLWFPRVELHFFYNLAVFLPLVVGLFYHLYPPPGEKPAPCTCTRRTT